jgi:hypothetical protein
MSDARLSNLSSAGYSGRLLHSAQNTLRNMLRPMMHVQSRAISELLVQLEDATTPAQLSKLVNKLQARIFKLPAQKQFMQRKRVVDVLTLHVLHSSSPSLRTEAANWLRMFVQASLIARPEETFVTLVTAASCVLPVKSEAQLHEQHAYLRMIFDSFWPYRYPYPAYSWEAFPENDVFYPLALLLSQGNPETDDLLISIFNELPTLHDEKISLYLLPVALKWAADPDSERRCRIASILCKLNNPAAQAALTKLQQDSNPLVVSCAKRAAECMQPEN